MSVLRPRHLQLFGERCSGTNYVEQLLRRNLPGVAITDAYGWKHGFAGRVVDAAPDCAFVVVVRDPFDWVLSLHRQPWHAAAPLRDVPLAQFLHEPWWCEWGRDMELAVDDPRNGSEMRHERDPATGERFANVMRLRAAKLRDWLQLEGRVRHFALVRFEDATADDRGVLRTLATRFGMRRSFWHRPVRTYKGGPDRFVPRQRAVLPAPLREWVAGQLDADLERRAGYPIDAAVSAGCGGN